MVFPTCLWAYRTACDSMGLNWQESESRKIHTAWEWLDLSPWKHPVAPYKCPGQFGGSSITDGFRDCNRATATMVKRVVMGTALHTRGKRCHWFGNPRRMKDPSPQPLSCLLEAATQLLDCPWLDLLGLRHHPDVHPPAISSARISGSKVSPLLPSLLCLSVNDSILSGPPKKAKWIRGRGHWGLLEMATAKMGVQWGA